MKRVFFMFLIIPIVFLACDKDDTNDSGNETPVKVTDYYPLSIGNYWIYQVNQCDSLEFDCEEYETDSVYISEMVEKDGNTYYVFGSSKRTGSENLSYVRDSGDFIIDDLGNVIFAINHYDTVLRQYEAGSIESIVLKAKYSISENKEVFNVAGTDYDCYNFKGEVLLAKDNFTIPRYVNNRFSKNVGLVYQNSFYVSAEQGMTRELIRFNVN
jgi:hypothetical protein